jgi:5-methylcytosine-specific restriction endonuclease McrA
MEQIMHEYTDVNGQTHRHPGFQGFEDKDRMADYRMRQSKFVWMSWGKGDAATLMPLFFCNHCESPNALGGLQIDHVHGKAHGGPDEYSNYQFLCGSCNAANMHHRDGTNVNQRTRNALKRRSGKFGAIDFEGFK